MMDRDDYSLNSFMRFTSRTPAVLKSQIHRGDICYVRTMNSTYEIRALGDNLYTVSGGWFDTRRISPVILPIHGCTLGSSMIHIGLIAARGLCIEFGNRVITSKVQSILLLRNHCYN